MSDRSFELAERRGVVVKEMRAIHDAAEGANRAPTADEEDRFKALDTENRALELRIANAEKVERAERAAIAEPIIGSRNTGMDLSRYSLARAIRSMDGGRLDGIEAEAHQHLTRVNQGRETRGIRVPYEILFPETRAQLVTPDTAGGYLVQTEVKPVADYYRNVLKVRELGATVLTGLVGNVDLPSLDESGSVHWLSEHQAVTGSDVSFSKKALSPKGLGARYEMSRTIRIQANESIEGILRRDIAQLLATALDSAAINSSGAPVEPTGILNTSGVQQVNTETALSDTVNNLVGELEGNNVPGGIALLTNSAVMKTARGLRDGEDRQIPLAQTFHNYVPAVSNNVPSNLGVGSNKSAIIAGKFSELFIGIWGGNGIDIVLNPYAESVANKGGAYLFAWMDVDAAVRNESAFAYALV
jgi:HK97 family phage major capsid protein